MNIIEITKEALNSLIESLDEMRFETGGILGGDGDTVNQFVKDKICVPNSCICAYSPNVEFLNDCIGEWTSRGVFFMGIYHTHISESPSLSDGDALYIKDIMNAMPSNILRLYFPVISIPNKKITCYKAEKNEAEIIIVPDELIII